MEKVWERDFHFPIPIRRIYDSGICSFKLFIGENLPRQNTVGIGQNLCQARTRPERRIFSAFKVNLPSAESAFHR